MSEGSTEGDKTVIVQHAVSNMQLDDLLLRSRDNDKRDLFDIILLTIDAFDHQILDELALADEVLNEQLFSFVLYHRLFHHEEDAFHVAAVDDVLQVVRIELVVHLVAVGY